MSLLNGLNNLDQDLTLQINALHADWSDHFWQFFSTKEVWYPMYLALAVILILRLGWKRGLLAIASIIATIVCCDQLANLVKDAVCRLRPCRDPLMIGRGIRLLEGKGNLYGFFSAHAANSFGFAVCSLMAFKGERSFWGRGYAPIILSWAFLVAVSRIFVGKHYLGDVLVGAAAGILIGWLFGRAARLFNERKQRKHR